MRSGDKGRRHVIHIHVDAEEQVILVLLAEVFRVQNLVGKAHALVVADDPADDHLADGVGVIPLRDLDGHQAVVDEDGVAYRQALEHGGAGDGHLMNVPHHRFGGQSEGLTGHQLHLLFPKGADAEFRPLGVQHEGDGLIQFLSHLLH